MRKQIIVGNWKMNNGPNETNEFIGELEKFLNKKGIDLDWAIAPPFISIPYFRIQKIKRRISFFSNCDECVSYTSKNQIPLAAQNFYSHKNGAFTGEISLEMLKELNVRYLIIGHSERREYFNESNAIINEKIKYALENDFEPIFCFGENLKEFEEKETLSVIKKQLKEGLYGIENSKVSQVILAYEPIWAIGTGKTATPEQAQDVVFSVRRYIKELFNSETANKIRIQYGGSVNLKNIKELMNQKDIDGVLVGGASLEAKQFINLLLFNQN